MAHAGPPPPPPPPNIRGPIPPQGAPFRPPPPPGGPGGPGGQQRPQGPQQGFPPMQLPIRQQSSRIVDITPPKMMDETSCLKKLTTYAAFTIRKAPPNDPRKDKPTWARSEVNDEKLSQEDIIKQIKKLNERTKSVAEKKAALAPNQGNQITSLLDDLIAREQDRNFEWTLAQLDRKERIQKHGLRETLTMTVFFKRTPLKELNPVILHQNIERNRHERLMQQNRPPPPPAPQQHPPQGQGQGPQGVGGGPPPQGAHPIFKVEKKQSKSKLPTMKKDGGRPVKKYHSDSSSSSSSYDSDTASDSDFGSSLNTSLSSRSRGDRRYRGKDRPRSYSRHREHRKSYYIADRAFSPERPGYRGAAQHHYSVPDVPRNIPGAVPGFDPVAAAYQAGKIDADAERFGMERERELERERYAPPQRPLIVERPVVIERPVPLDRIEPRAIVSYGRPEPRRFDRHYSDAGTRYVDDRYADEIRSPRDEEFFTRRERDAEDYIDRRRPSEDFVDRRRPSEFLERRRSDFNDPRAEPRIVYRDQNPFAPVSLPRRYPPPSITSSGW